MKPKNIIEETESVSPETLPLGGATCSADIGRAIMARADQLRRELTTEEQIPIIAAHALQHLNWHNLGSASQLLVAKLEQAGYLRGGGQGFVGGPSLPNA